MPYTPVHGLTTYLLACSLTKSKKLRLVAFFAGMLPDLDGVALFFNKALYYQMHHELFHPPIYGILLAVPVAIILGKYFNMDRTKTFIAFAASFTIHSIIDILFNNDWPVKMLWPFSSQPHIYPIFFNYEWLLIATVIVVPTIQVWLLIKSQRQKPNVI